MNLARHSKIIEIMQNQNVISIKELAAKLGCTEMTVRRNLDELQKQNFVRREHGYAHLLTSAQSTDYYQEIRENAAEKKAIAKAAINYIQPFSSVCLDSGTTVQAMIELIPDDFPMSVITPSLTAAMALSSKKNIQVLVPGGFLHHTNRSLLFQNEQALSQYHTDVAFLSCRSFQIPGGSFEHSQTLTSTKRALASISTKRILLLDYSKWNVSSICNSIPLEDLDVIITDSKAPAESIKEVAERGIELIVTDPQLGQITEHYNQK